MSAVRAYLIDPDANSLTEVCIKTVPSSCAGPQLDRRELRELIGADILDFSPVTAVETLICGDSVFPHEGETIGWASYKQHAAIPRRSLVVGHDLLTDSVIDVPTPFDEFSEAVKLYRGRFVRMQIVRSADTISLSPLIEVVG
jgi:hypothetical protein